MRPGARGPQGKCCLGVNMHTEAGKQRYPVWDPENLPEATEVLGQRDCSEMLQPAESLDVTT